VSKPDNWTRDKELAALQAHVRACRRCLEGGHAITPGAVFSGPVTATVMIVGQAPGSTEAQVGRPFNGPAGRRLFRWLAQAGWEEAVFRATQYMTAVTRCYPGKGSGGQGDRVPTRAEQELCAPYLAHELALVRPRVIVPVGGLAVRRFLGPLQLAEVVGEAIRDEEGHWIVPLPHPSGASLWLNRPENQKRVAQALAHLRRMWQEGREGREKDSTPL
jgi:uracil-DNA glycosylase